MVDTPFNTFNYTRFAEFVKLKYGKNEKIPQFLAILTQRAVGCQIKLTMPLLIIHELSNFVNFFCEKNSAVLISTLP